MSLRRLARRIHEITAVRSYDPTPPTKAEINAGVCGHCRKHWDAPGHGLYGCPDAADELHRRFQEEGL